MSRGYPPSPQRTGGGARAATASPARSLPGGGSINLRNLKIPAPPRGSLGGAAIALTVGYALHLYWNRDKPGTGYEIKPRHYNMPPGVIFHSHVIGRYYPDGWPAGGSGQVNALASPARMELTRGEEPWAIPPSGGVFGATATSSFSPNIPYAYGGKHPTTGQTNPYPNGKTILPGRWIGVQTAVSQKIISPDGSPKQYGYSRTSDIYYMPLGESEEDVVVTPPAFIPKTFDPQRTLPTPSTGFNNAWPYPGSVTGPVPTFPDDILDGLRNPPLTVPGTNTGTKVIDRGTALDQNNVVVHPLSNYPEVKTQVARETMKVISDTFGQAGETIDMMRCFMFATGNTYRTRNGEKAIPKWRWEGALRGMMQGQRKSDLQRKQNVSYVTPTGMLTADGRVLGWPEVGQRLVKCLAMNNVEDRIIGQSSKAIASMGGDLGLTAGPFGIQSLWASVHGDAPYQGLWD